MDSEELKEKIVNSATELFMRDGCKRVTMDQIATHMHISKRTMYEIFSNKEELLAACMEKVHAEIAASHRKIGDLVEDSMLLALFLVRHTVVTNHRYGTLLCDIERYYPEIHEAFKRKHTDCFRAGVMNTLQKAQSKNLLRPNLDLDQISNTLIRFMQSQRVEDCSDRDSRMTLINEMGFTFIRGLMTTEAIQRYDEQEDHFRKLINNNTILQ